MILKKNIHKRSIPDPVLSRLCKLYTLLEEMHEKGDRSISSQDIGLRLGVGSHSIRKDIGYLGETGTSGAGYDIFGLMTSIEETLGFKKERKACLIGLGALGSAIMNDQTLSLQPFNIVAGFDSNINKLETIQLAIPVFPTYEIESIVKREGIVLAVVTEPDRNIKKIAERLIEGGIQGIINFTPVILSSQDNSVYIRNIDIITEFRYLSALFSTCSQ